MWSIHRRFMPRAFVIAIVTVLSSSAFGEDFQFQADKPENHGLSTSRLDLLREKISSETKALLIIRNDKMVYEWYANDQPLEAKHYTASLAKAVIGGMSFAVAMNDGLINLDDPASKFVPEWKDDPVRSKIRIRHLGSHSSGIADAHNQPQRSEGKQHNEYSSWEGDFWRWRDGIHPTPADAFTISRDKAPVLFEPGSEFQYSNPGLAMLSYCVTASLRDTKTSDIRTLLKERVMRPIGIEDSQWACGYGLTETVEGLPMVANWGGASFQPRALARLGRLVLNKGMWQGKKILSSESISATVNDCGFPGHFGMGWWTNADGHFPELPKDAVWGAGAGHQLLLVIPSLDMIVLRNGGRLPTDEKSVESTLTDPFYVHLFKPLMEAFLEPQAVSQKPASPYPPSPMIEGLEFDFSLHTRLAVGSDIWPTTWAGDGSIYTAWGDGGGFGGTNSLGRVSLGIARLNGGPPDLKTENIWGGLNAKNAAQFEGKSYGILSVNKTLYLWVAYQPGRHLQSCRLAKSIDNGEHWTLSDWEFTFKDHLTIPTFLNFGQDYEGARDDYVYSYFIHPTWGPESSSTGNYGFDVHRPGRVYLSRVPKNKITDQRAYEFFAGFDDGPPIWTRDIEKKLPVFEDENGVGWNLSVSYVPALDRYLLCTEHRQTHQSQLGIFDATSPWGPWTTVCYTDSFGKDAIEQSCFYWSFPSPWLKPDGQFTMAFTGKNSNDSWNTVPGRFRLRPAEDIPLQSLSPVPPSDVIEEIVWAPSYQIKRAAEGSDNWPLTWGDDDLFYTSYGDGRGFTPFVPKKLSLGLATISGSPGNFKGMNIHPSGAEAMGDGKSGRKASGIVMIDGVLYLLVRNVKNSLLGWSSDQGKTWAWADWRFENSFGCPTFLNYGRDYSDAPDDYVYIVSSDSDSAYQASDQMVMCRVHRHHLKDRNAYRFFSGLDQSGEPTWTESISQRKPVFHHPGRCYRSGLTYNAGLKRYLWCQVFPGSKHPHGPRFQGGFGVFDAPHPWGPWTTAFITDDWDVGPGETSSFPTKWMSDDGRTVHLVFSGDDCFSVRRAEIKLRD